MSEVSFFRPWLAFAILLFSLCSCEALPNFNASSPPAFYDLGFPKASNISIETEQQIFFLDEQAKQFVTKVTSGVNRSSSRIEALAVAIFDRAELNLLYRGDANTPANETFHSKAANCLSLSIMAYALAKEAGFEAQFQEIIIPEYWTRRQGYTLLNGHINLIVSSTTQDGPFEFQRSTYQIDFDPQNFHTRVKKKILSKRQIVATYYNNKGADALLKADYPRAYAYFKAALTLNAKSDAAWINMGVLYRHGGYFAQAEQAYQHAISLNSNNLTSWENLARLYQKSGKSQDAQKILAHVEQSRKTNPYYFLNLGEEQFDLQNWQQAMVHFKHALSLDRRIHEVHFSVAKTYYELGQIDKSKRFMQQAKNVAISRHVADTYAKKLAFLSQL